MRHWFRVRERWRNCITAISQGVELVVSGSVRGRSPSCLSAQVHHQIRCHRRAIERHRADIVTGAPVKVLTVTSLTVKDTDALGGVNAKPG